MRNSTVVKCTVVVSGHRTSVSLEEAFWKALREIAAERRMRLRDLLTSIDAERNEDNLSSAIRMFVLGVYRDRMEARKGVERLMKLAQSAEIDTKSA